LPGKYSNYYLFPVSVWGFWGSRESNPFVAFGELNVEKCDQSLAIVIPLELELEGAGEGDVLLGAGLDVDLLDEARVGYHLIPAHTSRVLKFWY